MTDSPLVCFCTEKNVEEVRVAIRTHMKPEDEVNNELLYNIHKSLADGQFMGRCCGCMDEIEDMMVSYTKQKWS